jgi:hypothetical protein
MPRSRFDAEFMCELNQPEAAFISASALESVMMMDARTAHTLLDP